MLKIAHNELINLSVVSLVRTTEQVESFQFFALLGREFRRIHELGWKFSEFLLLLQGGDILEKKLLYLDYI